MTADEPISGSLRPVPPPRTRRNLGAWVTGMLGGVSGLAPHVLHHVAPLVGTALVAGTGGTLLFGALGLLASIPMLLGLRRRFDSWLAPAIALAVFAAMFVVSNVVIGPLISGSVRAEPGPAWTSETPGPASASPHPSEHHPS